MNIDIKDTLLLSDGNKYVVVSKTLFENKMYYYLIDIKTNNIKFCFLDNDELVETNDKALNTKLMSLFLSNIKI